jgi:hypothetical protein
MGQRDGNQGEGNREADRQFRESQTKFVQSEQGQKKIAEAGNVSEEEANELREAEQKAKEHAKGEDPQVRNQSGGSAGNNPKKQNR